MQKLSDEQTTIYNSGLSLFDRVPKTKEECLIEAIFDNKKGNMKAKSWKKDKNQQYAFQFLKQKLDPLLMAELRTVIGKLWKTSFSTTLECSLYLFCRSCSLEHGWQ